MKTLQSYRLGLTLALLLLLALRLPLLRCGAFGADVPGFNDEVNYITQARSLLAGDTYADTVEAWMRAPLPALLLMSLAWLRGQIPELVICDFQVIQLGLWVGLLLLLARLAALLFGRRTALVTAFLVALLPETALLSILVYSDTLFTAGLVVTVTLLLNYVRRPHYSQLILAGIVAGLAALARPTMLPLLPVLMLWIAVAGTSQPVPRLHWHQFKAWIVATVQTLYTQRPLRRQGEGWVPLRLLPPLIFLTCCLLTIAPWTLRNYLTYGGLILIDTTGPVNLWIDNSPATHAEVAEAIIAVSPNPVERQRFASEQAWAAMLADPQRLLRKWGCDFFGAWYPRSFSGTYRIWNAVLQAPVQASLLTQLNMLQPLVLLLLPLGLAFAPYGIDGTTRYRPVVIGLALCYTFMMMLTHFEWRYRTPFLLLLLPYAAWCLAHPQALWHSLQRPLAWGLLVGIVTMIPAAASLLWPLQWHNAYALLLHGRGLLRAGWHDHAGALADQRAAAALQPGLREARVAAAHLTAIQGDHADAVQQLHAILADIPRYFHDAPDAVVALQQMLLFQERLDEAARLDRQLSIRARVQAETLIWRQALPPGSLLRLGTNDLGLVQGFYVYQDTDDNQFRWSRPHARLLLAGAGDFVCLRLNAARPSDLPAPTVRLSARMPTAGGRLIELATLHPPRQGWARLCAPLTTLTPTDGLELHLNVAAYNPRAHGAHRDTRNLGVAVTEAWLQANPLMLDTATGLLLDRLVPEADSQPTTTLHLIGVTGTFTATPGAVLPLTLWWRGAQPPPADTFTFLHLRNSQGTTIAAYNAPLAGGQFPHPWVAGEPLLDQAALALPADLAPGRYRLVGGAFDPTTGTVFVQADLGEVEASFRGQGSGKHKAV